VRYFIVLVDSLWWPAVHALVLATVGAVMSCEGRIVMLLVEKLIALRARAWCIAARPAWQVSDTLGRLKIGAARR
jgi:hypothetical protein